MDIFSKLQKSLGENRLKRDVILAKYCSFRIGGPADYFLVVNSERELLSAVRIAKDNNLPFFILGGGTNVLFADKGFRGLVIKNESKNIKIVALKGRVDKTNKSATKLHEAFISVDSGVGVNRLVRFSLDKELSGLELFLGQPGTVGGAVYINAHNMKKESYFGDYVYQAKLLTESGTEKIVSGGYFHFAYDYSVLQQTGETVLSLVIRLTAGDKEKLWSAANEVMKYRQTSQPQGLPSAGCTFRNIDKAKAVSLSTPNYTTSAGLLLESSGLKGYQIGQARFSPQHANFIINTGGATAKDVINLIKTAKTKVKHKFGVALKEEIVFAGDF